MVLIKHFVSILAKVVKKYYGEEMRVPKKSVRLYVVLVLIQIHVIGLKNQKHLMKAPQIDQF